jgi:hypothetical protein
MRIPTCLQGVTTTGIAVVGITAVAAAPVAPVTLQAQSPPAATQEVRLAATTVPPGGLLTSFLRNQVVYCSIICPLLVQTAVTAAVTTLQTPGTFLTALQSGDLLKAIGATAASVTGPTNAAAENAILADSTIPAPRALNAFEVLVLGLLNVGPAAGGGLPGILAAIQAARQDTFDALNTPVVPNPPSTVMPHGVVQVAVIGAIDVGAAVIFPAFNDLLSAAFLIPDAIAQKLAATGDPVQAIAAGVTTAAGQVSAATTVIADSIFTALSNIQAAAMPAGLPGLKMLTKALDVATTTAQQAIQVAISLAVGGAVGAPIVAAGVTSAVQNFVANRNVGALLSALAAAELNGFGTAVGVVTKAVSEAATAIGAALNDPPASMAQTRTLVSPIPAAAATTTATVMTPIGTPTGTIKPAAGSTRTIGLPENLPTTRPVTHLPTIPRMTIPAVVTPAGASTIDANGNAAKAGGPGKSGDTSVGKQPRSVHGSHG